MREESGMDELERSIGDLVIANRILAKEEVVDAYGHVSIRHPSKPIITCCRARSARSSSRARTSSSSSSTARRRATRARPIWSAISTAPSMRRGRTSTP